MPFGPPRSDGDLDLFVANTDGNNHLYTYAHAVGYTRVTSSLLDTSLARSAEFGDLSGDGLVDLVVASSRGPEVFINGGGGGFSHVLLGADDSSDVKLVDVDNDGWRLDPRMHRCHGPCAHPTPASQRLGRVRCQRPSR